MNTAVIATNSVTPSNRHGNCTLSSGGMSQRGGSNPIAAIPVTTAIPVHIERVDKDISNIPKPMSWTLPSVGSGRSKMIQLAG